MNKPLEKQNTKTNNLDEEPGAMIKKKPENDSADRVTDKISEDVAPKSPQDMYPLW